MEAKSLARQNLLNLVPYEPGKPFEEVERELGITDVIKMASNENPLGPAPEAIEAMQRAILETNIYPDGDCYYLKQKLAAHLGVERNNIAVSNGSNEMIKLISKSYLNPGENIIMANPSFSEYKAAAIISGAETIEIPVTKDLRHDLDTMAAAINEKTKIIYVCNPNNPTGTMVTKVELENFLQKVPESVIVIMDEAYYEYVTDQEYPETLPYVKEGRNMIIMRTFSKVYSLAALRIGYAIAKPELIDFINRVREPFNVNRIAQAAAIASLGSNHAAKSKEVNQAGIVYLTEKLAELELEFIPPQTNFIYVDTKVPARALFQEMMKKGVIIRPGDIFGMPTYVRITIGTESQNTRLVQALRLCLEKLPAMAAK